MSIDIYKCPKAVKTTAKELTIGDLHANAMFFMHFLVSNGVAEIDQKDYEELSRIYRKDPDELEKSDIESFNRIIDSLKIDKTALIRLIGDEICDRGQNDYFILKILEKLKKSYVNVEIMLSNHGMEFLRAYEEMDESASPFLPGDQAQSFNNMKVLIEKKLISTEEVKRLVETYQPCLKLISYTLHDNDQNITLYSHAGIGLEIIKQLANQFGVLYQDNTAKNLANTINSINAKFTQEYVNLNQVSEKFAPKNVVFKYIRKQSMGDERIEAKDPIFFLIWNRVYTDLERDETHKTHGYKMFFVHGHDSGEQSHANVFNLNNEFFKGLDHKTGVYSIIESGSEGGPVAKLLKIPDLLKNYPVTQIYEHIKSVEGMDDRERNEYKKQLLTYQLEHLDQVTKWQEEQLPNGGSLTSTLSGDELAAKKVLQGIQYIILHTDWDIGVVGGENIRNKETGHKNTIPKGMYSVLERIQKAQEILKKGGQVTWKTVLTDVQMNINKSAAKSDHSCFNQRGETTRLFYERAKELINNLRNDARSTKTPNSSPTIH